MKSTQKASLTKYTKALLTVSLANILGVMVSLPVYADSVTLDAVQKAVTEGKTSLSMRYRYEGVDQDGIEKDANASTLRTRLTWKSANLNGFFANIEVDNVSAIGNENYNSTANAKSQYPVVADPTGTDLNQAYIGYKQGNVLFTLGRQRIVHNDQRFVGGVAWRQNEQTFDGYRVQYHGQQNLSMDYSYIFNVNRIFGPTGNNADLTGKLHLFNSQYKLSETHTLSGYVYSMDFDSALVLSNRTVGLAYDGKVSGLKIHAAYATQSDAGDNPIRYSTDYQTLELGYSFSKIHLAAGYESLGSDNGKGFITPLATLHKFQGFADKFLATPANGIDDIYIKATGKLGNLGLTAVWHDLSSAKNSIDYGTELNLVANYPLANKLGLMVKYAHYDADELATDTNKLWAMLNLSF
ncbi:hypothetical protein GMES_2109 [Paraglaciecola mesophila KMM 241]|uniref:Alginate export domain-containing protein n=1 Tax=Paraglaciecola mesophila KMM 241 TaxID=1128912 RepID=K6ZM20_9ALTE|nr:alginate export family protein [Paraglaciecola mesophila]GAC24405.1 hypothetical protein GMES_2109 [Paraglaciecola mesophila KMM 241]